MTIGNVQKLNDRKY